MWAIFASNNMKPVGIVQANSNYMNQFLVEKSEKFHYNLQKINYPIFSLEDTKVFRS
jgi:hypothetical protein